MSQLRNALTVLAVMLAVVIFIKALATFGFKAALAFAVAAFVAYSVLS